MVLNLPYIVLVSGPRRGTCFFFSSRRRHTRCGRDWSSGVCSSDLIREQQAELVLSRQDIGHWLDAHRECRSEERRVGKECRYGGGRPSHINSVSRNQQPSTLANNSATTQNVYGGQ